MGKALIILVFGASLSGSILLANINTGAVDRARQTAEDQRQQITQDIAESGYALGTERLARNFSPFTQTGVQYAGGTYDLAAAYDANGELQLTSTAYLADRTYSVNGSYSTLHSPCNLLGAVFLNAQLGPTFQLVGTGFNIKGSDTRPPSRTGGTTLELDGPGYTVAGILADTLISQDLALPLGGLGELNLGITLGGISDEGYLRDLVGCLLTAVNQVVNDADNVLSGGSVFTNQSFGSPENPEITMIEGDAEFGGTTRGYGVLLVQGDLITEGDFVWEGMVMAFGEGLATVSLSDDSHIYGALVGGGLPEDPGLIGGILGGLGIELDLFDQLDGALEALLDGTGAVTGSLGLYRRPMGFLLTNNSGIYYSEEALSYVNMLLTDLPGETRTVLTNERVGMAAAAATP